MEINPAFFDLVSSEHQHYMSTAEQRQQERERAWKKLSSDALRNSRRHGLHAPSDVLSSDLPASPEATRRPSLIQEKCAFNDMIPLAKSLSGLAPPALSLASPTGVVHGLHPSADIVTKENRSSTPSTETQPFEDRELSPNSTAGTSHTSEFEDAEQSILHDLADHIVPAYLE